MIVNSNRFNFQEAVELALQNYMFDDVIPAMEESIDEVSKEAVRRLKQASKTEFKGTGKYAGGWTREKEKKRLTVGAVVYNKKTPGLPHLLENGHVKRNGGRYYGKEHILPVEKWATEEVVDRFYDKLEGV